MSSRHTRAAIVAACRKLMQAGRLRPTMRACCARAGWSKSTGHRAFGPVAALRLQCRPAHGEERRAGPRVRPAMTRSGRAP